MSSNPVIVFVCEHGAAKSVIAAAHFNKLAKEKGMNLRGIARGTHPDAQLSSKAIAGLGQQGLASMESIPKKLAREDVESAERVVCFCELPAEYLPPARIEQWEDIPPVSESYETARDAIVERIHQMLNE